MKHIGMIVCFVLLLCVSGCRPPEVVEVEVNETQLDTVSTSQIMDINNCDGEAEKEQILSRSFTYNIIGFENQPGYENIEQKVLNQYSQYQNMNQTKKFVAPRNTHMEFNIIWAEDIHTGTIKSGAEVGNYNVRVPTLIKQTSSHDLGCPDGVTSTPNPTEESSNLPTPTKEVVTDQPTPTKEYTANVVVNSLSYCTQLKPGNCIYTVRQLTNKTVSIYFNLDENGRDDYFCKFDGKTYSMKPIDGYVGKYVCGGFPPSIINETILIEIFSSHSEHPLFESIVWINGKDVVPKPTIAPPDPYKP